MSNEHDQSLEYRIQDLINGGLGDEVRHEMLLQIARDDHARQVLAELLDDQDRLRQAFGYDGAGAAIRTSLEQLRGRLKAERPTPTPYFQRFLNANVLAGAAAIILLGVAAVLVMFMHHPGAGGQAPLARAEASAETLGRYQQLWSGVADRPNTWMLVNDDEGEFGTFAVDEGQAGDIGRLLVLQFQIVDEQGRVAFSKDMLVPAIVGSTIRVADAGQLGDRTVALLVGIESQSVTVGCIVARENGLGTGVTGSMPQTKPAGEIGRFQMAGQMFSLLIGTKELKGNAL